MFNRISEKKKKKNREKIKSRRCASFNIFSMWSSPGQSRGCKCANFFLWYILIVEPNELVSASPTIIGHVAFICSLINDICDR